MKHLWLIVFLVAVEVWKTESQYQGRWKSARSNEGAWPHDITDHPEYFTVKLGEHKLREVEEYEKSRKVEKIILHPGYVLKYLDSTGNNFYLDNDVALLKLSSPIKFDKFIRPICLLKNNMKFEWGEECYVTGWGHTKYQGSQPDALREAKVKLVPHEVCNLEKSYGGRVHDVSLCAGFEEGGVDACEYDSGGPLSCKKGGRFYLTGIVSWGHGCALPDKYGVYANMMKLTSWVRDNVKAP